MKKLVRVLKVVLLLSGLFTLANCDIAGGAIETVVFDDDFSSSGQWPLTSSTYLSHFWYTNNYYITQNMAGYFGYTYAYQLLQIDGSYFRIDSNNVISNTSNWTEVCDWTSSSALTGGNSSIIVQRNGQSISLRINGTNLGSWVVARSPGNYRFGIGASLYDTSISTATAYYHHVKVTNLN